MHIKGVIFDKDGTLVDTEHLHFAVWRDVLARRDIALTEDEYIQHYNGAPTLDNARYAIAQYGLSMSPAELTQEKVEHEEDFFANQLPPLMPYAQESVTQCHELGLALAIATGAPRAMVERTLATRNFYPLFSASVTCDDVTESKPAPETYLRAAQALSLAPSDCIAIEDSPTGIASAISAQIPCIAIPNAYSAQQDLSHATYIVKDLKEAVALIRSLMSSQ